MHAKTNKANAFTVKFAHQSRFFSWKIMAGWIDRFLSEEEKPSLYKLLKMYFFNWNPTEDAYLRLKNYWKGQITYEKKYTVFKIVFLKRLSVYTIDHILFLLWITFQSFEKTRKKWSSTFRSIDCKIQWLL